MESLFRGKAPETGVQSPGRAPVGDSDASSSSACANVLDQLRSSNHFSATKIQRGTTRLGLDVRGDPEWSSQQLAGRFVELSGTGAHATLTFAAALTAELHQQGRLVAWIRLKTSCFYPPDMANWPIDVRAVPVITAPDCPAASRAAYHLLCSAAFALVVLDLMDEGPRVTMSTPAQGRLAKLAQRHGTTLLGLTAKDTRATSLGSMVSLRAETRLEICGPGQLSCQLHVVKDKQRGPGWQHRIHVRAPIGMT